MGRAKKPLVFATLPTGCFICTSHKPNRDGYLRVKLADGHLMFHRLVLLIRGTSIPEGHEVDHICKNRGCSNPEHLRVLPRLDHLVLTNKERYAPTKQAARAYWLASRCSGTELAGAYDKSISAACRWIREWQSAE